MVFDKNKLFSVHHIGPATAYNLKNENSSTGSNLKLFDVLEKIDKSRDIVILVFGEIDCRIHIYYKYMMGDMTIPMDQLIDKTVSNYGIVLKQLNDLNINIIVCGIPAAGFEKNIYGYPFYASHEKRAMIYREFNEKLKYFCKINNYKYINIYSIVSDENGFIKKEYAADDVHLNEKILPFIEASLSKEYKGEVYYNSICRCASNVIDEVDGVETFEIRDEDIDVEEIMRKVKENLKLHTKGGAYPDRRIRELKSASYDTSDQNVVNLYAATEDIQIGTKYINSNWDIQNASYSIRSHRLLYGKALVKGRELIHGEVRRYVDPVIWKQREFNRSTVQIINALIEKIAQMDNKQSKFSSEIDECVRARIADIDEDIDNRIWLANILYNKSSAIESVNIDKFSENVDYINYSMFSDEIGKIWTKLSGGSVDTPNIFMDSVELFKGCRNVLDIGCGQGYFLKVMKQNNIGAYGIDLNEELIAYCQKMDINAIKVDALYHLRSIDDESVDGIFMNQVAEHIPLDELFEILKLSHKKLEKNSYIIINVPNTLSTIVSTNLFYLDPTHQKHLHPEVIRFLLKTCGFKEIQEKYYQPIPDEVKLKKIVVGDYPQEETMLNFVRQYNDNISKLNNVLFGYRDYCVIGKK